MKEINRLDFSFLISNILKGQFICGEVEYKGKLYFGILDKLNKTPVFIIQGMKDSMLFCEMLCWLSVQKLSKEVKENIKYAMNEMSDYVVVGEINSSVGVISDDLEGYPNSLLSFDNNELNSYVFYVRMNSNVEKLVFNNVKNLKINYINCWSFVNTLEGQSRIMPVYDVNQLLKWFDRLEILYICYILQYSAKMWCRNILKERKILFL